MSQISLIQAADPTMMVRNEINLGIDPRSDRGFVWLKKISGEFQLIKIVGRFQEAQMHLFLILGISVALSYSCKRVERTDYSGAIPISIDKTDDGTANSSSNGLELYQTYCSSCHGALESSSKRGKSLSVIKNAIVTIPQMSGLNLSDAVLQSIAGVLQNSPDPEPSRVLYGKDLYQAICATCHMPIESSQKGNITYERLSSALSNVNEMKSIALSTDQINSLVEVLKSTEIPKSAALIYAENCSSCHGPLEYSDRSGSSAESIGYALANVQAMKGIVLSREQIDALAKALAENVSGLTSKVVLGSRIYLSEKLNYLYVESGSQDDQDVKISKVIDTYILAQVSAFGWPCKSFVDKSCPKDGPVSTENSTTTQLLADAIVRMPFIRNNSSAAIHSDITSSRLGYIIQVCEKIHDIEKATLNVLNRSGLTIDSDPVDLTGIAKVWNTINPVVPLPTELSTEYQNLMMATTRLGLPRREQWRILSEQICQSGIIDFI